MREMLRTLYGYQAWANNDLFEKLMLLDPQAQTVELHTALRLISHHHVVAEIFEAHLSGTKHRHTSDNTTETPTLDALRTSVTATDKWYQQFVLEVAADQLDEPVAFTFTDGDKGRMTRHEMLLHVALHSAIHRGEVSRILWQLSITPPWDTFAVYLHQTQPSRRQRELLPTG
ncbi:DinB family protein [Mesorhizobium sp. NPDC059054]|uniref:DinB family protein n=1 Tax=Mesorhizobium sp. NPDC059054 TaxID=3346711 RepID=UPI0036B5DEA6